MKKKEKMDAENVKKRKKKVSRVVFACVHPGLDISAHHCVKCDSIYSYIKEKTQKKKKKKKKK
jgi:uncharacterized metal-binding protein